MSDDFAPGDVVICVSLEPCSQCMWPPEGPIGIQVGGYYRVIAVHPSKNWSIRPNGTPWLTLSYPRGIGSGDVWCACSFRKVNAEETPISKMIQRPLSKPKIKEPA
jgi:hypothetical protein